MYGIILLIMYLMMSTFFLTEVFAHVVFLAYERNNRPSRENSEQYFELIALWFLSLWDFSPWTSWMPWLSRNPCSVSSAHVASDPKQHAFGFMFRPCIKNYHFPEGKEYVNMKITQCISHLSSWKETKPPSKFWKPQSISYAFKHFFSIVSPVVLFYLCEKPHLIQTVLSWLDAEAIIMIFVLSRFS